MDYVTFLGVLGSFLSLIANIPQVLKVRKSNSTENLHSLTVIIHIVSGIVWSLYGFFLNLYILGVESGIVAFLNLLILLAILRDRYFCNAQTIK